MITAGYGLEDRCSISGRGKRFSSLHIVQTGSGAHPASYSKGIGSSFREGKAVGRETDHSPPSSEDVKNGGAVSPFHHTSS
jgi:hypothetical protein